MTNTLCFVVASGLAMLVSVATSAQIANAQCAVAEVLRQVTELPDSEVGQG
jgi:hypothetical protein